MADRLTAGITWRACGSKSPLPPHQRLLQDLFQRAAHALDLLLSDAPEERECQRARRNVFAHGKIARLKTELFNHVRLEMDRREVIFLTARFRPQLAHGLVAIVRL